MMAFGRLFIAAIALAAVAAPLRAEQTIAASVYLDRLQGMWLGEIIGQAAGAAYEGKYTGRGGNTATLNWSSILDPAKPWIADDDTVLEYMNLGLVYDYGIPSGAQLKTTWQTYVPSGSLWCANRQARRLMNYGFTPPDTGSPRNNLGWNLIDSQITTEALGAVAPGMRQRAADLAGAYGSVTNTGYALHAAQFYAAMYAAAPFEANVETVVAKGLEVVPVSSRSHEVIQNVVAWYQADKADGSLNWRSTQEKIYDNYVDDMGSHGRYLGTWVESTVNLAMTTMAILYGQGQLDPTVEIAINGGFDADCNPATAAGLVGLMKGYSGLPTAVTGAASNTYQFALLQNMPPSTTITQMAAYAQTAAEREIVRMGGTIEGSGAGAVYHLPDDVIRPLVEKPNPPEPRGLVRAVQLAGGTVTTSASVNAHNPNYDPANLDQIIDGITDTSYNGQMPFYGGEWYQLNFDRDVLLQSLIFYEGDLHYTSVNGDQRNTVLPGGFFLDLTVEIGRDGVFTPASNVVLSEPLDPIAVFQQIGLAFGAAVGDAVRIRGTPGGLYKFTTITELEAYGSIPTPVTCSPGVEPLWNNPANWSGGAAPGPQDIAVFGAAASRQITIGQAESALGLDLRAAGWTLDGPGKTLTVGAGGIASSGAGTSTIIPTVVLSANSIWTVGTGNILRLAGDIDGPDFALTKNGPGTLALSGSGAYGGGTAVLAGTLLAENTADSATGSGAVTVGAATLGGTGFINGPVTLTGDSTLTSTGTLTINNTLAILGLANQLAAGTVLTAGDVTIEPGAVFIVNGTLGGDSGNLLVYGTLMGRGTINKNCILEAGGVLSPGAPSSIQTMAQVRAGAAPQTFSFEIGAAAPNYANPASSLNDLVRLTNATAPFADAAGSAAAALSADTVIDVYFLSADPALGDYKAQFFAATDFTDAIAGATFQYWRLDPRGTRLYNGNFYSPLDASLVEWSVVPETATFAGDEASGYITQFSVVPEPATLALLACGMAALLRRRR
ncbi:MAG: ADP-ribosylglycohydrolase family protein [Planctomycetota bacterium]|nr:ADP-ribosylglycohydrolase family protein [Planctomycetota bacterium]